MATRYILILSVVFALGAPAAAGGHGDGGLPAAFALTAGDARALALGGAGVTLDGLGALYYNPAGLAVFENDTLTSSYRALSFERRVLEAGYGRPIPGDAGIGITWMNASAGDIEGRSYSGVPTENVRNSQNLFLFGFGRPVFGELLQVGVAGRLYYILLGEGDASGYGVDVGARSTPWDWLTVAVAARDVASNLRWRAGPPVDIIEDVPTRLLAGAALRPWRRVTLVAQGDVGAGEDWRLRGGGEFWPDERLALRAGLDDFGAPTLGAAVVLPRGGYTFTFDYAYVEEAFTAAAAHTATLTFAF